MKWCPQLALAEELVLGELDAASARRFREHTASCAECREEISLVTAERALFARRAEVMSPPPPALARAVRHRLDAERSPVRRALGHCLRRGHVSAAAAAALFVVAAFSRAGSPAIGSAAAIAADDDTAASGMLASFRPSTDEPLACSPGASGAASSDDGPMSRASSESVSVAETPACRASSSSLPCEPFVTCSWVRQ